MGLGKNLLWRALSGLHRPARVLPVGHRGFPGRGACFRYALLLWVAVWGFAASASAQYLRVVAYNIEADVNGNTAPNAGLYTVLEAIGEQSVNGIARPLDILAMEETTSNTATVTPIVTALNNYYGAGTYAMATYQGTQSGSPTTGNGPNALLYNTQTVQLLLQNGAQAVGVSGTPNQSSGINRQVIRYELRAINAVATGNFYLYVSHMKSSASGTLSVNEAKRNAEAQAIRADIANLPAGTSALYMGDFNMDGSTEAAYQTLTASGTGQAVDPLNNTPQNNGETWDSATYQPILTESSTALRYRDDIQFVTQDVYSGTAAAALRYVTGSYRVFGNNGTTAYGKTVNSSSNTSLNNLSGPITAAQALSALTTASDHLPVVVDYLVATPYNTWQLQHFTAAELASATVSGDTADPDGDGISNLLEYALNLDPKAANVTGLPTSSLSTVSGAQYLTLTYTQVKAAADITYVPQVSGDLATWNSGASYTTLVSTTNNADGVTQTVVVRDLTAATAANQRFIRLQVTRP